MIKEIQRRLENGERVELECIDVDGYLSEPSTLYIMQHLVREYISKPGVLKVFRVDTNGDLWVDDGMYVIFSNETKYFKIKENKSTPELRDMFVIDNKSKEGKDLMYNIGRVAPEDFEDISQDTKDKTFDDLFNLVVQAIKYGAIDSMILTNKGKAIKIFYDDTFSIFTENSMLLEENIKFVKSLCCQTFTIESEDDLSKIREGATVTLCNGAVLESRTPKATPVTPTKGLTFIDDEGDYCFLKLQILKGATVTQGGFE